MANLRDIKRRISSVKSTQKITRAMKMVAASKLRRAQESIVQARPYAYYMRDLADSLAARAEANAHPLLRRNEPSKIALVVFTSDRGLCGGFNANIVNRAMSFIRKENDGQPVEITVIGRKGVEALSRRHEMIGQKYQGHNDAGFLRLAGDVVDTLVPQYEAREISAIYGLYNGFKSAVLQEVTLEKLLPFEPLLDESEGSAADYIYEPSAEAILGSLLQQHLTVQVHRMLFESAASEYGARMTAMDAATRNAGDVIGRLTLAYNRARQDAITTQLIEVVSGAEAL
ncbi:MAG: ATP synthase F1 subunit gamma [Candidatus Hydrogenedens sp.]|nr:ATP synthase F1 subunit gamma [Candidatus Hydrogenedens sp.]